MKPEHPTISDWEKSLQVWEFSPVEYNLKLVEWSFEPVEHNLKLVEWNFEKPGQSNQTKTQVKKA